MELPDADTPRRAPEALAAIVKGSIAAIHLRLVRLMGRVTAPLHRREAAAYDDAAREAFRMAGGRFDTPEPVTPRASANAPAAAAPVPVLESVGKTGMSARPGNTRLPAVVAASEEVTVEPEPFAAENVPSGVPTGQEPKQAGSSAPDHLLRTPTGVTRVADDFFDGLIRRVEGDR